jgi:hypothetical protein
VYRNVTPCVTLFLNYLPYKFNQASNAMINHVIEVQNQNYEGQKVFVLRVQAELINSILRLKNFSIILLND